MRKHWYQEAECSREYVRGGGDNNVSFWYLKLKSLCNTFGNVLSWLCEIKNSGLKAIFKKVVEIWFGQDSWVPRSHRRGRSVCQGILFNQIQQSHQVQRGYREYISSVKKIQWKNQCLKGMQSLTLDVVKIKCS